MARPKEFRELIVWQKAMVFARCADSLTSGFPKSEGYGLVVQIRRAAFSIPSNIAEGHGRLTDLQFRHFLGNARGSVYELQTQIELAADYGYIGKEAAQALMARSTEVTRLPNALIRILSPNKSNQPSSSPASDAYSASCALKENE